GVAHALRGGIKGVTALIVISIRQRQHVAGNWGRRVGIRAGLVDGPAGSVGTESAHRLSQRQSATAESNLTRANRSRSAADQSTGRHGRATGVVVGLSDGEARAARL